MIIEDDELAKMLGKALVKPAKDVDRLVKAIEELTEAYNKTASKRAEPPVVKVNVPPAEVTVNIPEEKKEKPQAWIFSISRNKDGKLQSITATSK